MPNDFLNRVFFAEDFKKWAMSVCQVNYSNLGPWEPRMVIPFFDENGKLIAAQGRALGQNELRYITVKIHEDNSKIYGLDRWKSEEYTYIVEGPIDSMFLPNCLAVAGGDLHNVKINKELCVLIFDNEPRNTETVKKLMNAIQNNWRVVIWDKYDHYPGGYLGPGKGKDINDLVIKGFSKEEILEFINKNTFKGLKADWAAREWRNVRGQDL